MRLDPDPPHTSGGSGGTKYWCLCRRLLQYFIFRLRPATRARGEGAGAAEPAGGVEKTRRRVERELKEELVDEVREGLEAKYAEEVREQLEATSRDEVRRLEAV